MFRAGTRENNFIKASLILACLFFGFSLSAQKNRNQLEQEKRDNLERIAQAEKILIETAKERKATIGQLQALQNQIRARGALIRSMNNEMSFLESEIQEITSIVNALEEDLTNLKQEYAEMIYSAHKANQGYSLLTFLFSSSTFNQLFMRLKYLEQYSEARKTQAEQIEIFSSELVVQKSEVQVRRDEQEILLKQQIQENQKLLGLKTQQTDLVVELSTKESELRTEVDNRKKALTKLDELIADLIAREARGANVADVADNASFESQQSKLIWPVSSGFISSQFGRQPHPVLQNIFTENSGVGIQTNSGETIKSVSAGKVTMVADSPGMQRVVMVRHGQYLTIYARLSNVNVSKGQLVSRNDPIGTVFTDADGLSQLEFQVWKGNEKLDPEKWLTKK